MSIKCLLIILRLCVRFSYVSSLTHFDNVTWIPRVVSGWPAQKGDVPYQVALKLLVSFQEREYLTFCGAVIVAPSKLITAAHCFHRHYRTQDQNAETIPTPIGRASENKLRYRYAVAGNLRNLAKFNRIDSEENGQWRKLHSVFYPKKYKFPKHDIAVVLIKRRFIYNKYIDSIPIASRHAEYSGTCLVSGYGRTGERMNLSSTLLLAHMDVIPTPECSQLHRQNMRSFICTSTKITDVGEGDSGGPLVCTNTRDPNEGKYGILIGVVSGHRTNRGAFFTRISSYKNFINEVQKMSSLLVRKNTSITAITVKPQNRTLDPEQMIAKAKPDKNKTHLFYSTPYLHFLSSVIIFIVGALI